MTIQTNPEFQKQKETLKKLIELRGEEQVEIDQKYLTEDSIIARMELLDNEGLLSNLRVLAIGDADLAGTAISVFGNPNEVVVVDIDRRISEILFEANMEYDLPVRFVYHDMRLKLIEILFHQYSLVLLEPPPTEAGINVFLSRAVLTIKEGFEENLFVSIPNNVELRKYFNNYVDINHIEITEEHNGVNVYKDGSRSDLIRLKIPSGLKPALTSHWIRPFYSHEVHQLVFEYRCMCHEILKVGEGQEYTSIDELCAKGHSCGHKDLFSFHSKIPLL